MVEELISSGGKIVQQWPDVAIIGQTRCEGIDSTCVLLVGI